MTWRVVITITRPFENRANALTSLDAIIAKVPDEYEVRTQDVKWEP